MTLAEYTVLLADDCSKDADLVKRAFRKAGYENPIHAVCGGQEVVLYLKGEGQYADRARFLLPRLVLLDSKMLGMSGWEVLTWIRQQPEFASLPVIVFSGSGTPADEQKAHELGANGYEVKPRTFDEYIKVAKKMADLWLAGHYQTRDASAVVSHSVSC